MPAHVITLYDEIHRIFYLLGNLSNDPAYKEVRIAQDEKGHYLFLLPASGNKVIIRLANVKIPPSTGDEVEDIFKTMSKRLNDEFKSLI